MRPLLSLVCMFKDEADNAAATILSAAGHVDQWVVVDTGSSDGTPEVVQKAAATLPCAKGGLFHELPLMTPLRNGKVVFDFAANRNRALEIVRDARYFEEGPPVFTLFLSGHETLHVDGDALRKFLEEKREALEGAYSVEMHSAGRAWPYTRVLRVDGGWRYSGVVHECPIGPQGEIEGEVIPGVVVVHAPPNEDAERKIKRLRQYDLPALQDVVEDESLPLEARAGSIRFLAETHALLAADIKEKNGGQVTPGGPWLSHQMAAMSYLWRYADIAAQPQKQGYDPYKLYYALMLYYSLAEDIPGLYKPSELMERLEWLAGESPDMPEAHFLLARLSAKAQPDKPKNTLFYALSAAKAARAVRAKPISDLTETSILWRAMVLASVCAERIAETAKSKEEQIAKRTAAKKYLALALQSGAPPHGAEEPKQEEQAQ